MKKTLFHWAIGMGASMATLQGSIGVLLGVIVTVLTVYRIILDIQIKRRVLRKMKSNTASDTDSTLGTQN
jgi:hypothetical protein